MPRKSKSQLKSDLQLEISFDEVISSAEVASRQQDDDFREYDPLTKTAEYMQRAVEIESAWETTIQKARDALLKVDTRQLYFDFLTDLKRQIE